MKNKVLRYLKYQSFRPNLFSIFINPFYLIRRELYTHIRSFSPHLQGKLLDFGCGRKPYETLFAVKEYIGLDMQQTGHDHNNSKIDVFYDGKHIPFPDECFDSLFCSEVFEHVFNIDEVLPEINRVLKKGAQVLITVPFCWNEHEVPFDNVRYSSFGIKYQLEKNGFRILKQEKSGNFVQVCFQLWSLYFFELFRKFNRIGYVVSLFFILPINVVGFILSSILPKNHTLFFNNIVLAEKVG